MATATASQLILDVLAAFQLQDRVFTAYDVTQAVRAKTSENIRHSEVQDIVHGEWMNGDFDDNYERNDMVQLDVSGKPFAIVYYPDIKNWSDHPKAIAQPMPAAPAIAPAPTPFAHPLSSHPTSASTPSSQRLGGSTKQADGSYVCETTAEGRVNIPKSVTDKVNKDSGTVDVTINGSLEIVTPNSDGRIRLNLLSKGFSVGDKVSVELTANDASITVNRTS